MERRERKRRNGENARVNQENRDKAIMTIQKASSVPMPFVFVLLRLFQADDSVADLQNERFGCCLPWIFHGLPRFCPLLSRFPEAIRHSLQIRGMCCRSHILEII